MSSPWDFGNNDQTMHSPVGGQRLEYDTLSEMCQGGPLNGACFWLTQQGQRIQLPGSYGGPPVWEAQGYRVALPFWSGGWFQDQQLAVLDTHLRKLIVFRQGFSVLHLQEFEGLLITGVDSPVSSPRSVSFNAGFEAIKRVFEL